MTRAASALIVILLFYPYLPARDDSTTACLRCRRGNFLARAVQSHAWDFDLHCGPMGRGAVDANPSLHGPHVRDRLPIQHQREAELPHTRDEEEPPTHGIRHGRNHPWDPHDGHQDVGEHQYGQRGRRRVLP